MEPKTLNESNTKMVLPGHNYYICRVVMIFILFAGMFFSGVAQTTVGDITTTLDFCEGDTLTQVVDAPSVSGTYISGSETWTMDMVPVPNSYALSYYDTDRILYYRVSVLDGSDISYLYSNGKKLNVKQTPHLISLNILEKPCEGDTIMAVVQTNESNVTWQWYLDNDAISGADDDTLYYELNLLASGKTLSVKATGANGCSRTVSTPITTSDGLITLPQNVLARQTDYTIFPVTTGVDFEDPVIDYTAFTNVYFITYDNTTYTHGTPVSINIPYLGSNFTCSPVVLSPGAVIPASYFVNNTILFVDSGEYILPGVFAFRKSNLHFIGSYSNGTIPLTILNPNYPVEPHASQKRLYLDNGTNKSLQNIIIDGKNALISQHAIRVGTGNDGLLLKDIRIRNIGQSANSSSRSVIHCFQGSAREPSAKRYFINITIENQNIRISSGYDLININTADGLYFRNLDIQTSAGNYCIAIAIGSNDYTDISGCKNIIFAGTLTLPSTKTICILKYSSRRISFPENFRFVRMRYGTWDETGTSTGSSAFFLNSNYSATTAPGTNYVLFDLKESAFIVNGSSQLDNIRSLYMQTNVNNACRLPLPLNIKYGAALPTSGSLTIPDCGAIPTHIIFTSDRTKSITTTDMVTYNNNNVRLSHTASRINYVKVHNLDFTTLPTSINTLSGTSSSGGKFPNSTPGNFHNCKFAGLVETASGGEMVLNLDPLVEVSLVQDGLDTLVTSGNSVELDINASGQFPIKVYFMVNSTLDSVTINAQEDTPYKIIIDSTQMGNYLFKLTGVDKPQCAMVSGKANIQVLDCDSTIFSIQCQHKSEFLLYGECYSTIQLDTPVITNPYNLGITLHSDAPGEFVTLAEGQYSYTWTATENVCQTSITCTQWVVINYPPCGNDTMWSLNGDSNPLREARVDPLMTDVDGRTYKTVRIGCDCWTAENNKTNGGRMYYSEKEHPDSIANFNIYGKLYTWEEAQQICPGSSGWILPSDAHYLKLANYNTDALKTVEYWLLPNSNTNSTGFSALPAGYYNGSVNKFYYLLGDTWFWSSSSLEASSSMAQAIYIFYCCSEVITNTKNKENGYSVRCVRTNLP